MEKHNVQSRSINFRRASSNVPKFKMKQPVPRWSISSPPTHRKVIYNIILPAIRSTHGRPLITIKYEWGNTARGLPNTCKAAQYSQYRVEFGEKVEQQHDADIATVVTLGVTAGSTSNNVKCVSGNTTSRVPRSLSASPRTVRWSVFTGRATILPIRMGPFTAHTTGHERKDRRLHNFQTK